MAELASTATESSPGVVRVLVADDHQMFAESIARIFADEPDLEVVSVCHASAAAVELAQALHPDVAVVDYHLPDADGATTAAAIRVASPNTKVVMVTGSTDERLLLTAIEAGCAGLVTKDKAVSELVTAVRAAQAGEAHIQPRLLANLLKRLDRSQLALGADLTVREREILDLLGDGLTNQAIADRLVLSLNTVRNHVQNILAKLGAHSKLEAVIKASRAGILLPPAGSANS